MTKEKKQEVISEFSGLLDGVNGLYSIDFTGLDVENTIQLRRNFKEAGVTYKVAKNTLVKIALRDNGSFEDILDRFVGQTGVAMGYDDPAAPARVLKNFLDDRKSDIPKLNFAVIEGVVYEGDQLKAIASMPSRADIIASIVGSLHAPISGIVGSVNAVMRDLASVIEEVAKKNAGGE